MFQNTLSPYPFLLLTLLLFIVPGTFYLFWLSYKRSINIQLIAALICLIAAMVCTFAHKVLFPFLEPLWPLQNLFMVGMVFFEIRLAYLLPEADQPREGLFFSVIAGVLLAYMLIWTFIFSWQFFDQPGTTLYISNRAYQFVLLFPFANFLAIFVYFRRMMHFGRRELADTNRQAPSSRFDLSLFIRIVKNPPNYAAKLQRNFAFISLFIVIPSILFIRDALQPWSELHRFLPDATPSIIAVSFSIAFIAVIYFNMFSSATTLRVKFVGLSMILLLFVAGTTNLQVVNTLAATKRAEQLSLGSTVIHAIRTNAEIEYPDSLIYIAKFPSSDQIELGEIAFLYQKEATLFDPDALRLTLKRLRDSGRTLQMESIRRQSTKLYSGIFYQSYLFSEGDQLIELGFSQIGSDPATQLMTRRMMTQTLVNAVSIPILVLIFFHRGLAKPLNRLLEGVSRVLAGDLRTPVQVGMDDEIGYLTRSFNSMTDTLRALNEGLEEKVSERTEALEAEIVQREEVQRKLEIAKRQAEDANHAKSDFLTSLSHELQTPLNVILGYARLLQTQSDESRNSAEIIEQSGNHLLDVIKDVLDMSKVEANRINLRDQEVALAPFLRRIAKSLRPVIQEKGVKFSFEINIASNVIVHVDPMRLHQVIHNLLSNAARYTDSGSIKFYANQGELDVAGTTRTFTVQIQDTGIGIAAHELSAIFDPFYQTLPAQERGEGSGLGLAISRQLVELMNGGLDVKSQLGQGSTFTLTLHLPMSQTRLKTSNGTQPHQQLTAHSRIPSGETLTHLKELANSGDIVALRQETERLEQQLRDGSFIAQLKSFMTNFQMEQMTAWFDKLISAE